MGDIEQAEVAGGIEWSARVTFADQERMLRFGGPAELVSEADASAFLLATLVAAMAWHHDLEIDGPVSPLLLSRVDRIARMYHLMDPTLRPPTVTVAEARPSVARGAAVAAMFSRGADSTYTAAVPRTDPGPLDALLYCRTLEPNHDAANQDRELAMAGEVAARIGLPLHALWTDLRAFTDPMLGWSTIHGSGLGAMAVLVGQAFRSVVVATGYDIAALVPCGSHPALDPMFSTEAMTLYHDDLDRSRQDKLAWLVANRPDLVAHLKVCYSENRIDNCGRCHKCLMTMAGLRAAGGLHLAEGFPTGLDLHAVRQQRIAGVGLRQLWVPIVRDARERDDTELAEAVGDMLKHSAVPTIRELLGGRWKILDRVLGGRRPRYDPERATTFERLDRVQTDNALALIRHGEIPPSPSEPPRARLRASTLAGSIAASATHRRTRRDRP